MEPARAGAQFAWPNRSQKLMRQEMAFGLILNSSLDMTPKSTCSFYLVFAPTILSVVIYTQLAYTQGEDAEASEILPIKSPYAANPFTGFMPSGGSSNLENLSDKGDSVPEDSDLRNTEKSSTAAIEIEPDGADHLLDVLAFPNKLSTFDFSKCTMSTCFDLRRCNTSDKLRVHIVAKATSSDSIETINTLGESNIIHDRILQIIRQSEYYEPDLSKACLLVPEDDLIDRDPLSKSFRRSSLDISRPGNGYGMNYLIFNLYSGTWPDYQEGDFSGFKLGGAILAKASNSEDFHRKNYDISIPLFSYQHPKTTLGHSMDRKFATGSKKYLVTFKGKRYVIGSGSETRNSLYHLNNGRDVVMLTTCRHGKKWQDSVDKRCDRDERKYDKHDFTGLMSESTFCLTPRGRRLGSFRFLEALNNTCIPVVLGDGWVWPFDEIIDWSKAAIQYPEREILLVPDNLRDITSTEIQTMQRRCSELYERYFASVDKIVTTVLKIIERRIYNLGKTIS